MVQKILITDDDEQNRYMLQVLLKGHGYTVETATDGAKALEMARRDPPDMIISDILMPVMDGFTLCRQWKAEERLKEIPFIFYTATYTDPRDEALALNLGAERFIVKPVEPDVFIEMLREVIQEHQAGQLVAPHKPVEEEAVYLQEYNEALVRKLEEQTLRVEAANRRLATLHEIDKAILAAQLPEAIAQATLGHLQRLVPCPWAGIVLFDFESEQGIALSVYANDETRVERKEQMPLAAFNIDQASQESQVEMVDDIQTLVGPPPAVQRLQAQGIRSYASVPIVFQKQLIGCLYLGSDNVAAFASDHVQVACEVTDQLAIAIHHAHLHERVQHQAARLARALEQQQELDRLKSEFIQNVSHELRTPLAIARGYIELLERGKLGELPPDQQDPVNTAVHHLRLLSDLVDDLTAVLDIGVQGLTQRPVDLGSLVRTLLDDSQTQTTVERAQLTLTAQIAPDLPLILGDPTYLHRMVSRLLSNACKFTPAGGQVAVRLGQKGTHLVLEITDTGIGIPSDRLERIFERFYQVDGSTTRRYGGTGLGLALVKEIAEVHGGRVTVESQVGQGSTFTVWLPVIEEEDTG